METITKGRLGYNLVEKELLKRDWDLYLPILENTKIDCIAIKGDILIRMQIKILAKDKSLPVRKISHNQGEYKIFRYDASTIDFFIGVDIDTEDIYIVPVEFSSKYHASIGYRTLQPYKNAFNLMEPNSRNTISGDNDIGESLTGNTEGTM